MLFLRSLLFCCEAIASSDPCDGLKAGYGIRYCLTRSRMGAERLYDATFHGNAARPDLPLRQTIHYNAQDVKILIVAPPVDYSSGGMVKSKALKALTQKMD
ncbi:hypothetical protein [Microvirga guangxiensis]|uniref:hypothetical protein n=1 Tax=Microvirga guangxiensis TaxID=549386 RepID=UPI001113CF06|nr:hypothetical protein [Microvirga guangxiensis]